MKIAVRGFQKRSADGYFCFSDIVAFASCVCKSLVGLDKMTERKNLCAQIPIELYGLVNEAKARTGQNTNEYITDLLTEYYEMKKNGGNTAMTGNTRTMAFQIPEELFQRIKAHLERETIRTGHKLTQREFVLGLIETALNKAERQTSEETSNETDACEDEEPVPEET